MKIYGGGSLEDIGKCCDLGVEGILTNPQGFEQYFQGTRTLEEIAEAIVRAADVPVYIQIHGRSAEELVERGRRLHAISPRVGFKIIADAKGFPAIRRLQKEGVRCIATCLFSISQAAVAATVGAFGICPFVSRARETGIDAYAMLSAIRDGYDRLDSAPQIIAVSLKGLADVELAIAAGVDAVGMRYPLLKDMMGHMLSQKAETLFGRNWTKVKGEDVSYLAAPSLAGGAAE